MAKEPDPREDFSLDELGVDHDYPIVTQEVDSPEFESDYDRVSVPDLDKAPTATDVRGSFLLRDSFGGRGQDK